VVTRASGDNPLAGVGAAIELRSRLQRADLERRETGGGGGWEELGGAWVRLPAGRAWGAVHFTGGAVLGSYPHICYDALLGALAGLRRACAAADGATGRAEPADAPGRTDTRHAHAHRRAVRRVRKRERACEYTERSLPRYSSALAWCRRWSSTNVAMK
jgi:hypothetical protein